MNKLTVSRREVKYYVSLVERLMLIKNLNYILEADEYGGYNGYKVRSLYFDTPGNQDYHDKVNKKKFRTRVRLRIYDVNDQYAKLEVKRKFYDKQIKDSLKISKADAIELIAGNYDVILKYPSDITELFHSLIAGKKYRPVTIVQYSRRAYTHRDFNTRVTLDNNLCYCEFNDNLFSEKLNFKHAMPLDKTILEVKYEKILFPAIQNLLNLLQNEEKAPSKYGTSRNLLKTYNY